MVVKYRITNLADRDLSEIWGYTFQKWSIKQADKYYDSLIEVFKKIACDPNLGKNYVGVKFKKHIIFYRKLSSHRIEVVRILHERMNFKREL